MSMNDPSRPRSTPIPGDGDIFSAPPPTTGEFLGSPSPLPGNARPGQAPPQHGQYNPAAYNQFGAVPPGQPLPTQFTMQQRRRSPVGCLIWSIIIVSILAGVGAAIWGVFVAKDAIEQANDLTNPDLSGDDLESLGLPEGTDTLLEDGGVAAVVGAFEDEIGSPLRVTEILVYPDYAFVEAQDPDVPTNIDRYQWRSGDVDDGDAQPNQDDLETALFSADEVNYDLIANIADQAPTALGIPDGETSYIIITRGNFGDGPVVVRYYVNSERDSGYLEADAATGEVLAGF